MCLETVEGGLVELGVLLQAGEPWGVLRRLGQEMLETLS